MNTKLRYIAAIFAVTLALVWCIPSLGQVTKGSISGTVVDPQGAVVSGAQVKAKNIETGMVASTTTDSAGLYRLNLLPVGTYNVEVTAPGFKTASQNAVAVGVGRDTGLGPIRMAVGEASTTVEVTGEAPLIETTQAQVSSTFAGLNLSTFAGIQENEGLDRLALFVPGIVASRSDNFSNTNGGGFSSNGLRGRNNDQEIDGQNNNDNSVGGPGLFLSNVEFVQQYVIVTNNFGPEYGRNAGSVVNIITKSGTNAWHGSVFGYENSSYLNALSNTQKNTNKPGTTSPFTGPPRSNNEFSGGTIGGPIMKNKIFSFFGFDNQIVESNTVYTTSTLTPTPQGLAKLAACFPTGNQAAAVAALAKFGPWGITAGNPSIRPVSTLVPATGCATITSGVAANLANDFAGVTRVLGTPFHGYDFVEKVDTQIGANDNFMGRYLFNRGNNFNTQDNGAAGYVVNVLALSQTALLSWTHNFSSHMVNESRVAFGRLNVGFGGNSIGNTDPTTANILQGLSAISITGGVGFGPANNLPQGRIVNTWQAQDNWNYVRGKHQLKAGVNWTYQRSPNVFLPGINGIYQFTNYTNFFNNTPGAITIAQGNPVSDFREYDTFIYGGDDWKISRSLTLNLGLTWSYYGQPANLFHDQTVARESGSGGLWNPALPIGVRTFPQLPAPKNSFGPSVGFAYSPQWGGFLTGHGKTVFRGGFRELYDPAFYNIYLNIASATPQVLNQSISSPGTHPMPATPSGPNVRTLLASSLTPGVFDPRTFNESNVTNNFSPDRVYSWTFGFERQIGKNSAFEARYAGNRGTNLFQSIDGNPFVGTAANPGLAQVFPNLVPSGVTGCTTSQQVLGPGQTTPTDLGRAACGFGLLRTRSNTSYSDYHAVQTEFRANNLFKQLNIRAGYTFSKTTDNVSEIFGTNTAGNNVAFAQNPFDFKQGEHSLSGLNIPNAFTLNFVEQFPFFREQHGFFGHLLGGWQISADYIWASGQPYTVQQLADARISDAALTNSGGFSIANFGNFYDNSFVAAFVGGVDSARAFIGSNSAPQNTVGIFAGDYCMAFLGAVPAPGQTRTPAICNTNNMSPTTLLSLNALNGATSTITPVAPNAVRFIVNARFAQQVFGTPFGNSPRNALVDAPSNLANASIIKGIKLGERANMELHLTANNVFNHFNFANVDPFLDDAGKNAFGTSFANPSVTGANGRSIFVGARFTF
jgi:carboxypeptidase family protein